MFQRVREMASGSLCLSLLKPSRLLGRMKDRLSQQRQERPGSPPAKAHPAQFLPPRRVL